MSHRRAPLESDAPAEVDAALSAVRQRFGIDLSGARARAGFTRGHLLELLLCARAIHSGVDERAERAAEDLLRRVIGRATFDDWVGRVRVAPLPSVGPLRLYEGKDSPGELLAIEQLRDCIEEAIRGVRSGLPAVPYFRAAKELSWTMLEVEPTDPSGEEEQNDLFLATTLVPEMLKSFLRGEPVRCCRFSNHGETFCYLKWEDEVEDTGARLERRTALEDALDSVLGKAGLGCVVGSGLGLRYSYVHVALTDVPAAMVPMQEVCGSLSIVDCKLLFFDVARRRDSVKFGAALAAPP